MAQIKPAYSAPFQPGGLRTLERLLPLEGLTREWAWGGGTGAGVKVAVIDSGIDADHPAVGGVSGYVAIEAGPDGAMTYDEAPHRDVYGHGTACAGIIRSFAPACELYSVRVLGATLATSGAVFAAGLRWALDRGMHVCNLSLGTPKRDCFALLHELADEAYFANVMLVTAANNIAIPCFPSVYASVISVGSHEINDPDVYYYNPAPPVEFGAHGVDVHIAWRDGGEIVGTGNSYATPHIAGLVAKTLGKHPGLSVFQMKAILRALASNVTPA